jgi:hypothetical protein
MDQQSMTQHYRSQFGEDRWLDANWSSLKLPDVGYFVEFGSGDGTYLSNTYWLQHAKNWNGLLIDGDPRNKGSRDGCDFVRAVIGDGSVVSFGLHLTETYLSGVNRKSPRRREVRSVPLSELLREHRVDRVDLISIDTEGTELECWRTLDLNRWRPTIAIIELETWRVSNRANEITAAMSVDGYDLLHRTQVNGIYRSRD